MTHPHPAILDRPDLLQWRYLLRTQGKRLVQCHGCFDIVHPGHIRHLRWAKAQGDALLVTITADQGINKGPGRPLIPHHLRAENLASLDMVDAVHVVHEPTAEGILRDVTPDIYVKGQEYESNNDPRFQAERDAVEAAGGRVVFSSGDVVFSSSALIAAIEGGRDTGVDAATSAMAALLRQPGQTASDLADLLHNAQGTPVLVVGEAIQEVYNLCQAPMLASREPVMTLRPAGRRHFDTGAAGVAIHLAAMGMRPTLLTCPPPGTDFHQRMARAGVEIANLPPTKEPLLVEHYLAGNQKLITIDHAKPIAADTTLRSALLRAIARLAPRARAVCVADQGLGLLGGSTGHALSETLREYAGVLTTSTQARGANPLAIRYADLMCLSEPDLRRAVPNTAASLTAAAWSAMDAARADAALVTLGPEGSLAYHRLPEAVDTGTGWPTRVRAQPVPSLAPLPMDANGTDAAVLAAATLAMTVAHGSGQPAILAALLAALAEAAAAARPGFNPVSRDQLLGAIERLHSAHLVYHEPHDTLARTTARAAS